MHTLNNRANNPFAGELGQFTLLHKPGNRPGDCFQADQAFI